MIKVYVDGKLLTSVGLEKQGAILDLMDSMRELGYEVTDRRDTQSAVFLSSFIKEPAAQVLFSFL